MRIPSFLTLSALLAAALPAAAQDIQTADRFLASVGEKYGAVKDYQAKITITVGKTSMTGAIAQKHPGRVRIDFSDPKDQVIVYDGQVLTVYLPEYRAVLSQTTSSGGSAAGAGLASAQGLSLLRRSYIASYTSGPDPVPLAEGSLEMVKKLTLSRRSASEGFREIVVSVDPVTLLIRRMEGRNIADETIVFDFKDIVLDQGIPDARFLYDSPASANIFNNFLFKESD